VVLLQGSGMKTYRKVPVDCLSQKLVPRVDVSYMMTSAMSSFTKMLLNKDEKKEVQKTS